MTSTSQHLLSLADRVEGLSGPDREVDGGICLALGWTLQKMKGDSKPYFRKPGDTAFYQRSTPPAFTASIDAAMSLVPDDCLALVRELWDNGAKSGFASLHRYSNGMWADEHNGDARTMALALCAASLRAIAGGEG